MAERRTPPLVAAIAGALLGVVVACMAKGAQVGWGNGNSDWALLNALFGMVSGPVMLLLDYLTISGKGPPGQLLVVPWAGVGAIIGAVVGILSNSNE